MAIYGYHVELTLSSLSDGRDSYYARLVLPPECHVGMEGDTPDEALMRLEECLPVYAAHRQQRGHPMPPPTLPPNVAWLTYTDQRRF